jgi:polyvinyl alcohol dehydrogenase (cytochrome)
LSRLLALFLLSIAVSTPAAAQTPGEALFERHCAMCHVGGDTGRAPNRAALSERTPEAILNALVSGVMRSQAAALTDAERRSVAEYLAGRALGTENPTGVGRCAAPPPIADPLQGPRWNGWGVDYTNSRFQAADQARLAPEDVPRLRLKWAFGFPGASSARAQPTVAAGRLFVGSETGVVYALDARTGCTYWTFAATAGVRTAITIGPRGANASSLYFGDGTARVYAIDAGTGDLVWMRRLDEHPHARITGTPVLFGDRLYVPVAGVGEEGAASAAGYACCTFRGSVAALDAATGAIRWKTYTIDEPPKIRGKGAQGQPAWGPAGASVWSAPTIDVKRRVLYVGTGNLFSGPPKNTSDAILALDLDSGAIKWVNQRTLSDISIGGCRDRYRRRPNCPERVGPDLDFASSPMLVRLPNGRDLIIAGQKSGIAWALDPDNKGKVVWQYRAGEGGPFGGIEWGAATEGGRAFFAIVDDQSALFSRPEDTAGQSPGGLHAVRLDSGERSWFAPPPPLKCVPAPGCSAAQSAAVTAIPGVVFSGSFDGGIRAFSSRDGSVLWEFDTNRDFDTVNGVKARGASIGGPGPVIVDGMLYVNSGYGSTGGRPGNVLLAFDVGP